MTCFDHQSMQMFSFLLSWPWNPNRSASQAAVREKEKSLMHLFFFSFFQSIYSLGGIKKSLLFHKAWPPNPVSELYLCFVSALMFPPLLELCGRVFIDHTTWQMLRTKAEETRSDLLFLSSSAPPLRSSHLSLPLLHSLGSLSISFSLRLPLNQGWSWDGVFKNSSGPGHVWHQLLFNQGELMPLCYIFTKQASMRDEEACHLHSGVMEWSGGIALLFFTLSLSSSDV